jgi:hypothetical protein
MTGELELTDYKGHDATPRFLKVKTFDADKIIEFFRLITEEGLSNENAARTVGATLASVVRQCDADPAFAKALEQAEKIRVMLLESKAFTLAYDGEEETVVKGGLEHTRTTYPNWALGQFLLKNWKPEKYTDKSEVKAGPLDTPPPIVRGDDDRQRLLGRVAAMRLAAPPKELPEGEDAESDEEFGDLL